MIKMVNTHEIQLGVMEFETLRDNNYIIIEVNDIEVNDYILFKQVEKSDLQATETGLFMMTQVTKIIKNDGLKVGYGLLIVNKL